MQEPGAAPPPPYNDAYPPPGEPVKQQPYPQQQPSPYPPQQPYPPGTQVGYQQQQYGQTVIMAQPQPGVVYTGPAPDPHSTLAWLTCLFCFWPLGLVAIIKSNEVNSAMGRGDIRQAQAASDSAKKFGFAALGCGVFQWVVVVIFMIIYFAIIIPNIYSSNY